MSTNAERVQTVIDRFAEKFGPCCGACDHWRWFNSLVGECVKTPPVSGAERVAMLCIRSPSLTIGAGHIMTPRDHLCGAFVDTPPA